MKVLLVLTLVLMVTAVEDTAALDLVKGVLHAVFTQTEVEAFENHPEIDEQFKTRAYDFINSITAVAAFDAFVAFGNKVKTASGMIDECENCGRLRDI